MAPRKRDEREEVLGLELGEHGRARRRAGSPRKPKRADDWGDELERRNRQRRKASHKDESVDDDDFDGDDDLEEELDFDHQALRDVDDDDRDDYYDDDDCHGGDYDFD